MEKERFSMLLLDPGEIFFEDLSCQMKLDGSIESDKGPWIDGRLKFCSKSLVFVCKDINQPLIKIQFKDTATVEKYSGRDVLTRSTDVMSVLCKQYVEMLEGNILAPYKFMHSSATFLFSFNYVKVDDILPQISQLLRAASLPTAEQNAMIMTIVHSRQSRFSFDTSWLEDLYEQIVFEIQANKVLPLVINPGRILLTTCRIYFQPYNNLDKLPVFKINLKDIKNVIKRRFLLRQVGLEIRWTQSLDNVDEIFFLATKTQEERDSLYTNLLNQSALKIETVHQNHMTVQWQNGSLSNYDYLLYLNSLADRTFHDLTQYPVMPWVLQDFTSANLDLNDPNIFRDLSKPVGALEPKRLERLKARYSEMSDPKFLYGSHYSAPGFVLFYLVRKYPQYMLCLQNGRFDHPDRMFNSVADVWKNVLGNMSDFKELIPEFYDTSNKGDFLINNYGIDFGFRYDGLKIGDVQLPPWATDPSDFVQKLRNALESDWVSNNLHNWIDLIFGYKQRGEEAVKADNVFFHLCYEGAIDLDTIKDINDRHGLEVQIMEFGQIPKQIFKSPHPRRLSTSVNPMSSIQNQVEDFCLSGRKVSSIVLQKLLEFHAHKDAVSSVISFLNGDDENIVSVGRDGLLKMYSMSCKEIVRSVALSPVPLASCISYQTSSSSNVLVAGSWDNSLIFYDVEYGRIVDTLPAHSDRVSGLAFSKTHQIIISSSWDCTIKIWKCPNSDKKIKLLDCFVAELDHDSQVTCIDVSRDETMLVSGTEEGEIYLWNLNDSYSLQFSAKEHLAKINSVTFDKDSTSIISCASDKTLNIMDVQTSTQIYHTNLSEEAKCLAWIGVHLLIGDNMGDVHLWNPQNAVFVSKFHCHQGAVMNLTVSLDHKEVITGGSDKKVIVWECKSTDSE
ncbi:hypothetical protein QAD02_016952 [Eretmocerus hayati]|uniref:Uncharacterized protein n=1 Tax=Eretmocerus hayati TaxID=131215 RepID=A0ACC2PHC9_9HYME|nr:hypothetical protein QAD02_016952 [Eretmocerus hayati]